MANTGSGLFFYVIGKVLDGRSVLADGSISTFYGKGRDIVVTGETFDPHTTMAYTRAEIVRALAATRRSIATLDAVSPKGLEHVLSTNGKGRGTIAELLRRRNPEHAEAIIDAMVERHLASLEEDLAA